MTITESTLMTKPSKNLYLTCVNRFLHQVGVRRMALAKSWHLQTFHLISKSQSLVYIAFILVSIWDLQTRFLASLGFYHLSPLQVKTGYQKIITNEMEERALNHELAF